MFLIIGKKRKILLSMAAALLAALMLSACTTFKAYTFSVETGDSIKVSLDTTNGLKLTQSNGTFTVSDKKGEALVKGMFGQSYALDLYRARLKSADSQYVTVTSETDRMLKWDNRNSNGQIEHNRINRVTDKTCVFLSSIADQKTTDEVLKKLTISKAK